MPRLEVTLVGLLLALQLGCGYALVGRGVSTDPSIKTIGVPLFEDDTGKPGIDQQVTEKVIEELLKRGRFDVVQTEVGVDAVVTGRLTSYRVIPVGFSESGEEEEEQQQQAQTEASRYAIVLSARVRYQKVGETEPIWENTNFTFRDEYDVGDDPQEFFDREDQTIERLTTEFSRNLVSTMLEAF
jgi:hypothetical protein